MQLCGFVLVTGAMLSGMTAHAPLHYEVVVVETDARGFVRESRGECVAADSDAFWGWFSVLVGLHYVFLLVCGALVYKIRDVPSKFNEGKYIAFSLMNHFQITMLALLLGFFIRDKPDRLLLIKSIALLVSSTISLVLMYAPKVIAVYNLVSRNTDFINSMALGAAARSDKCAASSSQKSGNARSSVEEGRDGRATKGGAYTARASSGGLKSDDEPAGETPKPTSRPSNLSKPKPRFREESSGLLEVGAEEYAEDETDEEAQPAPPQEPLTFATSGSAVSITLSDTPHVSTPRNELPR